MSVLPRKIANNTAQFTELRAKAATGADAFSTPTDALIAALVADPTVVPRMVCEGSDSRKLALYWSSDTPTSTADLAIWIRDGGTAAPRWMLIDTASTLAPDTLAIVDLYRANEFFVCIGGTPGGDNIIVRGFGFED